MQFEIDCIGTDNPYYAPKEANIIKNNANKLATIAQEMD